MPSTLRGFVVAALVAGLLVGGGVWASVWAAGGSVRPWLMFSITIASCLLVALVARLAELRVSADGVAVGRVRALRPAPPTDRERGGLDRLERLLDKAMQDPGRFDFVVRQRLRDLVDHRLRMRYGVDSESDPVRVHDLVGDQLWAVITTRTDQVPTREQLTQWVQRIEAL
jgi:hypothetical protein